MCAFAWACERKYKEIKGLQVSVLQHLISQNRNTIKDINIFSPGKLGLLRRYRCNFTPVFLRVRACDTIFHPAIPLAAYGYTIVATGPTPSTKTIMTNIPFSNGTCLRAGIAPQMRWPMPAAQRRQYRRKNGGRFNAYHELGALPTRYRGSDCLPK